MSSKIPQAFIEDLLSRVDIVDVIDATVPLRKAGKNYVACCPFHDEKTPSFTVSVQKQFYHCFGCGEHGNAISFLMTHDRMDFIQALQSLADRCGMVLPQREQQDNEKWAYHSRLYQHLEAAAALYQAQLADHPKAEEARTYLKARGLSSAVIKTFGLGFALNQWDSFARTHIQNEQQQKECIDAGLLVGNDHHRVYDRFRGRVMFPIRNRKGQVIAFGGRVLGDAKPKYLNSPETPVFHKGFELYGLYEALQARRTLDQILIVEGYMDVIALAQHGIDYAMATLGTALSHSHMKTLLKLTSKVIVCFDGDEAGRKAAQRALETALEHVSEGSEIRFMFLPEGDDPDTLVRKQGKRRFEQAIDTAMPLSGFLLETLVHGLDLNSIDARTRLVQQAKPILEKISDRVYRQLVIDDLSRKTHIEINLLMQHLGELPIAHAKPRVWQQKSKQPLKTITPMRLLIALLIQYPQLAECIEDTEYLERLNQPGVGLLLALAKQLKEKPNLTTASIIESYRGREEESYLAKLAAWTHTIPEEGIKAEFKGALRQLGRLSKDRQLDALLELSKARELNSVEKSQLQALLSARD